MLSCERQQDTVEKALASEQVFLNSNPSSVTWASNLTFLIFSFLFCKIKDNDT